jgi:hypothetical protein
MHRSRNVFERSKRRFFCFARDFFALGADLQWAQTFSGRGPSAGAGWKSALHGDREVMFKVVMTVVICPGAEAKRCEWWIENMQRQDVHRRREFVQRLARLFF